MTDKQKNLLARLVLNALTEIQYSDTWPGDEVVQDFVDLYHILNPTDTTLTVKSIYDKRSVH